MSETGVDINTKLLEFALNGSVDNVSKCLIEGANVNCHDGNFNTPLHLTTLNPFGDQKELVFILIQNGADCDLRNLNDLTPSNLAMLNAMPDLATYMLRLETANLSREKSFYKIIRRGCPKLLQILIELYANEFHIDSIMKSFAELKAKGIPLSGEVIVYIEYLIIEYQYKNKQPVCATKNDVETRTKDFIKHLNFIQKVYDSDNFNDIDDQLVFCLRRILENIFFVKNKFKHIPLMQMQFCLGIFLEFVTTKIGSDYDIYVFVIDKGKILRFLKQILRQLIKLPTIRDEITTEKYWILLKNCQSNIQHLQIKKKNISDVRNQLKTNPCLQEMIKIDNFSDLDSKNIALINDRMRALHELNAKRRQNKYFKGLIGTYFTLKQLYSIKKILFYVDKIVDLNLNDLETQEVNVLAIKRALQVLGETVKSTKQTPNITKKWENILGVIAPQQLLEKTIKLREFLSHDYSLAKYFLNQNNLIHILQTVQDNLKSSKNLFLYMLQMQKLNVFKGYLGRLYRFKNVDQMKSYIKFVGTDFKTKLMHKYVPFEMQEILVYIEMLRKSDFQWLSELDIIEKMIKANILAVNNESSAVSKSVNDFFYMEKCLLNSSDGTQTKKIIKHIFDSTLVKQRYFVVDKKDFRYISSLTMKLLQNETNLNSKEILTAILNRLNVGNVSGINSFRNKIINRDDNTMNYTLEIMNNFNINTADDDFCKLMNNRLKKYYFNIFALDHKYQIIKELSKDKRIKVDKKSLETIFATNRSKDKKHFQIYFDKKLATIKKILFKNFNPNLADYQNVLQVSTTETIALEFCLLEITEILCSNNILLENIEALETYVPIVNGRNLRNYLAHDFLGYDALASCANTVVLNALYFAQNHINIYNVRNSIRGSAAETENSIIFNDKLKWLNEQINLFEAAQNGDYDKAKLALENNADLEGQNHLQQNTIDIFMNNKSEEFINCLSLQPKESFLNFLLENSHSAILKQQILSLKRDSFQLSYRLALKYEHVDSIIQFKHDQALTLDTLSKYEMSSILKIMKFVELDFEVKDELNSNLLHLSALNGSADLVEFVITQNKIDINSKNSFGQTPLFCALKYGFHDVVKLLIENGADVNIPNEINQTPIWCAAILNNFSLIDSLINDNTDKNPIDFHPLMAALEKNHVKVFKYLYEVKKFNLKIDKIFHVAARLNRVELLEYILCKKEANELLNSGDENDFCPLQIACICGHFKIAEILLENCVNVYYASNTNCNVLHCAVFGQNMKIIELLVHLNVDLNATSQDNMTPLSVAVRAQSIKIINFLIQNGAKLEDKHIMYAASFNNLDIIKLFIKQNDQLINAQDDYKRNLIMHAAIKRNFEMAKMLIQNGVDVNRKCLHDLTCLHFCAQEDDVLIAGLLLENSCEIDAMDALGKTPMIVAIIEENIDMINLLLKRGSNKRIVQKYRFEQWGASLLHNAASKDQREMVEILLEHFDFDPSVSDENGETPLNYATANNHSKIINLLTQYGAMK